MTANRCKCSGLLDTLEDGNTVCTKSDFLLPSVHPSPIVPPDASRASLHNVARGALSFQSIGSHDVYELNVGEVDLASGGDIAGDIGALQAAWEFGTSVGNAINAGVDAVGGWGAYFEQVGSALGSAG